MIKSILLIILGFVLLVKGADFLVDGASGIAKKFGIPSIIVGLTIVSIGTSMPELFVSTNAALKDLSDMSLGNAIGSNLCNLLLILGLSALIKPVVFQESTIKADVPFSIMVTSLLLLFGNTGFIINFWEALIFMLLFFGYNIYNAINALKQKDKHKEKDNISMLKCVLYVILGIVALKFGGDFTVDNATIIAKHFNVSDKIIGLTILAVGTSLPELFTSVTAAIKGNSDIAIGNVIGSNIFNILLILGSSALLRPITYNITYNNQIIILIISTLMLFAFYNIKPKKVMGRVAGLCYLTIYIVYMISLF